MTLLNTALREPRAMLGWTLAQWELAIRLARRADLLSRLAALLEAEGLLGQVPAPAREHLEAGRVVALAQEEAVRREVAYLSRAFERAGTQGILLKGAAYLFAALPAARGRLFSDVDVLVPREALGAVEAALMLHGWATTHHHPYDQRYYRQWMHELPPLQHATRQTVVDVHHAILPPTARVRPDPAKLWAASRPLSGPLRLLAPVDMVLHSASHLFFNEEFTHGLRDLADLDSLLRHFGTSAAFWEALPARAQELELGRPLYYALRYTRALLGTPVPEATWQAAQAGKPSALVLRLMDALFMRALQPDHPSAIDGATPAARNALYVRAHWLRMPPLLLAYHLSAKALRRPEPAPAGTH